MMEHSNHYSKTETIYIKQHTDPDTATGMCWMKVTNPDPWKEDNDKDETDKVVEEVKLKQVDSPWKPRRLVLVPENLSDEELRTQELYRKFRGILNKLTPMKFDTLLRKVLELEIDNQKRLEGVIELLFKKAIEEPIFSEVYANLCLKLSNLKVPSGNHMVNFRGLILSKCQTEFKTEGIKKESADTAEPSKKQELQVMIDEENRKMRLRAVANIRLIGELYKVKMLTYKIMDYCMRHLIDHDQVQEVKLECLCELLTTIGEQVESEGGSELDSIFKKMQEIVERKSNKIINRVRFVLQDVIDLRKEWVDNSVLDSTANRGGYYRPLGLQPRASANKMQYTRVVRRYK